MKQSLPLRTSRANTFIRSVLFIGFSALAIASIPESAKAQQTRDSFRVSDPYIITAPDGGRTQLRGINIRGQVVGAYGPVVPYLPGAPPYPLFFGWQTEPAGSRSFVWSREHGFRDLGILAVAAINDCGDMAGTLTASVPHHAFRKVGNRMQDLGTLEPNNPNAWSVATGINERGDVVGVASVSQDPTLGPDLYVGFLWTEANGMVPVHDRTVFGAAFGVNNRRQIAGFRQGSPESALAGAAIWDSDGTFLGWAGLGGRFGRAMAINSRTEAVGLAATDHQFGPLYNGFFWSPAATTIEMWPGGPLDFTIDFGSDPYDIDDRGRIAGVVNLATTSGISPVRRAAVWTSPTEYFVLLDQSSDAVGINNRGEVIGHLFNLESFTQQGVIWKVHTPNDKTILDAAFSTLTGLAICRHRKWEH